MLTRLFIGDFLIVEDIIYYVRNLSDKVSLLVSPISSLSRLICLLKELQKQRYATFSTIFFSSRDAPVASYFQLLPVTP